MSADEDLVDRLKERGSKCDLYAWLAIFEYFEREGWINAQVADDLRTDLFIAFPGKQYLLLGIAAYLIPEDAETWTVEMVEPDRYRASIHIEHDVFEGDGSAPCLAVAMAVVSYVGIT
jgi:hypothetical protein